MSPPGGAHTATASEAHTVSTLDSLLLGQFIHTAPQRGCRLEIIVDQYPCKSDLEPFFKKCLKADNLYFYAD